MDTLKKTQVTPRLYLCTLTGIFICLINYSCTEPYQNVKPGDSSPAGQGVDSLYQRGRALARSHPAQALELFLRAKQISTDIGDSLNIVISGRLCGQLYRRTHQLQKSVSELQSAYRIGLRNGYKEEVSTILNAIAITHTFLAEYDVALKFHFMSLEMKRKTGDLSEIGMALNNIGLLYYKLQDFVEAESYFQQALETKLKANDSLDLDRLYINIGLCHYNRFRFDKGDSMLNLSARTCTPNCTFQVRMEAGHARGLGYYLRTDWPNAEKHFLDAFEIASKTDDRRYVADVLLFLGKIAMVNGQMKRAEKMFITGEIEAQHLGYKASLLSYYLELMNVQRLQRNDKRTIHYQDKYIKLKNDILSDEIRNKLALIQVEMQRKTDELIIAHSNELLKVQKRLTAFASISALLFCIIIFTLAIINRSRRRIQMLLAHKVENRTWELKVSTMEIEELEWRNTIILRDTCNQISAGMSRLSGILNLALLDIRDKSALSYFTRLHAILHEMSIVLQNVIAHVQAKS